MDLYPRNMERLQHRIGVPAWLALIVLLTLAAGTVLAGPVAAQEETSLAEMDGSGTEDDPYVVTTAAELQAMNQDLDAHYVLGDDIDASETESWNARSGFEPIGDDDNPFAGSFDGQGHTVTGLTIDRPSEDYTGLFGRASDQAKIRNVAVEGASVRGADCVGVLAGSGEGDVVEATVSGSVSGSTSVGGVAGCFSGELRSSGASTTVESSANVAGGLVGGLDDGSLVFQSYATGDVSGANIVGGLVGAHTESEIRRSYATGDVSGGWVIGGLVGKSTRTTDQIRSSYATGDVSGERRVGGLIGWNSGTITESYAIGAVTGDERVGGLVGERASDEGNYDPKLLDSYWNIGTSTHSDPIGRTESMTDNIDATGLRTDEMTGADAPGNLDRLAFGDVYAATDEYPILRWQVESVDVSLDDAAITEGQRTDATVTLSLTDGTTVTATEVAEYDSDSSVATVDAGRLTTESVGETDVTATVAGQSDTATLEVLEPPEISQTGADIGAEGVVNGSAATITATYENTGGMAGYRTAELVVDGETVATNRTRVDLEGETTVEFEFTPEETGEYDVAVDGTDAGTLTVVERGTVSVRDVSAPEQVGEGTTYRIDAHLVNDADVPVAESLSYSVDGETVTTESVAVAADGSTVTLDHAVEATGSIDHSVAVGDSSATASSEIVEPPEFVVNELDAPDAVESGETVEIAATVENTGGLEHTRAVALQYGGENVSTIDVTLAPGESTEVVAEATADEAGSVDYAVDTGDASQSGSLTVEGTDDGTSSDGGESDDGSPGFGVTVALVALSLAAATFRKNR